MPSRSKRAPTVPQRSSPRLGLHPTNSTESSQPTQQRGQKRPLPYTNGLDGELRRKSSRLQLQDSVDKHNVRSVSEVISQGVQKKAQGFKSRGGNVVLKQEKQSLDLKDSQVGQTQLAKTQPRQTRSQKALNVNGDVPDVKSNGGNEVISSDDERKGLIRRRLQKKIDDQNHVSERDKERKNTHLEGEKVKEGGFLTASSDRRYPLRKCENDEMSSSQRHPLGKQTISQSGSEKGDKASSSSGFEKQERKEVLKESKKTHTCNVDLTSLEPLSRDSLPLIQWLPSPVVAAFGFEKNVYICLNCTLEFLSLKGFIQHCMPTSKVPCYLCGDEADCTCKERIHYLIEHQFICFYCPERFATAEAAKHHRLIIHPNERDNSSTQRHPTFHGKSPIDLAKLEKPRDSTYIIILGKMKLAKKHAMPWVFGAVDSVAHLTKGSISIQCEKFLYKVNDALISETLRKTAVMCPLCFKGFVGFEAIQEHMINSHRPNSIREIKSSGSSAQLLPATGAETTPVSHSTSFNMVASSTTQSAFCRQCHRVFQDETSLGRHNVIVHSLSTVHKKALAQKAKEDVKYNVALHMCNVCKCPFQSEKALQRHLSYSQHRDISNLWEGTKSTQSNAMSSSTVPTTCSGNVNENKPVQGKENSVSENSERGSIDGLASSGAFKENLKHVIVKESREVCRSESQKDDTVNSAKKDGKDHSESSRETSKGLSLNENAVTKTHPNIVKSRKPESDTSSASWYLPKALFSFAALHNAPPSVTKEVDMLIQNALNFFAVEKHTNLRSPHATADRYKFSRATAAYLKLKPVLENPPQTPTARRNYELKYKYKIPMGHLNPEFADCPLFPTLTDIFRRTKGYTSSPLRILPSQEIKQNVCMSSRSRGKIARRFSRAVETAFMLETQHCITKVSKGHAHIMKASAMQAHTYLSGKVSALINERINNAVFWESQQKLVTPHINAGHSHLNPNQATVSGAPVALNGLPLNSHQHGTSAEKPRYYPIPVLTGGMLPGHGMSPSGGRNLSRQDRYVEMPVGNNRALLSVNAQGLATVVGLIPGARNATPSGNLLRPPPVGLNRGPVILPHTFRHGVSTSLYPQVPHASKGHILNPVNPVVTMPAHSSFAIPHQRLPVVSSYLAQGSSLVHPSAPSKPHGPSTSILQTRLQPNKQYKDTVTSQPEGKKTVLVTSEEKALTKLSPPSNAQQETDQSAKVLQTKVSTQLKTASKTLSTRPEDRTPSKMMAKLKPVANSEGRNRQQVPPVASNSEGKNRQQVPKDRISDRKKICHPPSLGATHSSETGRKIVLVKSPKTGRAIFRRNAGKRVVKIKKKRLPSSEWLVNQLHARLQMEAKLRNKIRLRKKYVKNLVPTKEIKPVAIETSGVFCKASDMDAVLMVSEAVKRGKKATILLDDFQDLCDKFGLSQ